MLDTDQLRSFLAIVDSGSFTKAAERVHKTQSAVSMHIRRLEEQLGCALFVKQGRGARLTDEGEKLIEFARRIVQVEAGAFAALSRKGLRGAVRLGIPDDYAESFLADILAHYSRRHPLVEVLVVCEASSDLAPQVAAGALDLALITDHQGLPGVEVLRNEPLVWVASERFQVEEGTPIPLALGSTTCCWRRATEEALEIRAGPYAAAVLLQELQRHRHGSARRAGGDDSARLDGRTRPQASRPRGRLARIALDPHGPHSRARTPERRGQGARRIDPPDPRRRGAPGRLSAARSGPDVSGVIEPLLFASDPLGRIAFGSGSAYFDALVPVLDGRAPLPAER